MGRKLVAELGLEPGTDTLARWMAHRVAELIARGEQADPHIAEEAQRECVETIIALWKHRASLPGHRPLQSFEPIFRLLDALAKPVEPWYFRNDRPDEDEAAEWLSAAKAVDRAARDLIRYFVSNAASTASEVEADWLKVAAPLTAITPEVRLIIRMHLGEDIVLGGKDSEYAGGGNQIDELIQHLDMFVKFAKIAKKELASRRKSHR